MEDFGRWVQRLCVWGATCKGHIKLYDLNAVTCKKRLDVGAGMSSEECCRRLKLWLLEGLSIDVDDPEGRQRHLEVQPRELADMDDATIEAFCP